MAELGDAAEVPARSSDVVAKSEETGSDDVGSTRGKSAMAREKAEQDRLQRTADFREGIAAVGARRPANFQGE